ncbi:MAG: RluA family pseudouridine synthase [Clostridia bacterium]|nr:RluA family pseudouridine synthase [Clostridia bacterium]
MRILYEDGEIVVCVKDAGVLSQPNDKGSETDMTALLAAHFEENGECATPFVVHRLDRGTAGVMVYAKNGRSAAVLSAAASGEGMKKTYLAVVEGKPTDASGELTDLLFFDRARDKTYVVDRPRRGVKEARLSYEVKGSTVQDGRELALVRVTLYTGRTHQIRAQFASRRLPLYGDARYGAKTRGALGLFACSLSFSHPKTGEELTFSAEPCGAPFEFYQ